MSNLKEVLAKVNGATIISLDTITVPKLKGGKNNPHRDLVAKIMTGSSVMVFQNKNSSGYDNMVRRRLVAEGKNPESFVLGPRSWGTRLPNTPIVHHINKDGEENFYLEVIFLKPGEVKYQLNGVDIAKEDIIGLDDKDESEQGGLDDKVIIRTFNVAAIQNIRAFGETFTDVFYE